MVGIIGEGFGLYGYLPSFVELGYKVGVVERSKKIIEYRPELNHLSSRLDYFESEKELFQYCNQMVLATNPIRQEAYIDLLIKEGSVKKVFLEKPITINPTNTSLLIEKLQNRNINFNVGFNFFYTNWFRSLYQLISNRSKCNVLIKWNFTSFYLKNESETWKKSPNQGGGLVNFYGIHLISVLAAMNFDLVESQEFLDNNQVVLWEAKFKNETHTELKIMLNINSEDEEFFIGINESEIILAQSTNPFSNDKILKDKRDPRIKTLKEMILSNNEITFSNNVQIIKKTNDLLAKVLHSNTINL